MRAGEGGAGRDGQLVFRERKVRVLGTVRVCQNWKASFHSLTNTGYGTRNSFWDTLAMEQETVSGIRVCSEFWTIRKFMEKFKHANALRRWHAQFCGETLGPPFSKCALKG